MAPTAVRELIKLDREGNFIRKYETDKIVHINLAGERCDPNTVEWLH
jgi:propionyl-CoA synthetase